MSYASFTKSFPSLIKTLPLKLFQPTGIAVMASIGIHALVGVSLPYLPLASQEKQGPLRNVRLVELSPAEQSRLPQPAPLPSFPNQLQSLYPLPSAPSTSLPSLSSKDLYPLNLPPIGPLPPGSSALSLPAMPQLPKQQAQSSKQQQLTLKSPTVPQGMEPVVIAPIPGSWRASRPDLSSLIGGINPAPLWVPPDNSIAMTAPSEPSNQTNGQSGYPPNISLSGAANLGVPGREYPWRISTINPTTSSTGTTQAAVPTPGQNSTGNSNPNVYDPYNRKIVEQLAQNLTDSEQQNLEILPPVSGSCPANACSAGVNYEVVVKVNVDDKGNITSNKVVSSSGKEEVFDSLALSTIRGSRLPATGKAQTYLVPVHFQGDSRLPGSLTGTPTPGNTQTSPKPEASSNPQASPKPEASSNPQASPKPEASSNPQASPKPEASSNPQASPKPEASSNPQASPKPEASSNPQTSPKPEASSNPQTSPKPEASSNPQTSPKPEASSERLRPTKPEASSTPQTSPKPEASSTPQTSPKPEASSKPQSSPKPEASGERLGPPKPEASGERQSPPKPETSSERPNPPKSEAASERQSPPKPETSSESLSPPKPETSGERLSPPRPVDQPER